MVISENNQNTLLDLNIIPEDFQHDDTCIDALLTLRDENENSFRESFEPFVGKCFLSEEEAYIFYQQYAKKIGFSVRKGRFITKDEKKIRRDFFCHREGRPNIKFVDSSKEQRNKLSYRCECSAHMRITLKKVCDIFLEKWQITKFVENHNHALLSNEEVRFLPAYRMIDEEDEKRILLLKDAGLSIREIMRVMELEKKVKHGYLPFLNKDFYNYFDKKIRENSKNDAMGFLHHCVQAKSDDSKFQYYYKLDGDNKLESIFWCPAQCFDWYQKFGDVVVFDTTYKVNSYDMPFGIFIGIDCYGRTVLFGCALLRDETRKSFQWLMKTFVSLMKHPPKTILTDQDPWMTEAISIEMPPTKHAFCIWHITSKFSGWFTSILRNQYLDWCSDFYKLYRMDSIVEFEDEWPKVISRYSLNDNKHVKGLYRIKEFWVPAYLRGFFFGGMTTTGRSESINAFIKRFVSSHSSLVQLMKQVHLAMEDIEQTQIRTTMLDTYRGSSLRTFSPVEEQAHDVMTPYAFKMFQEQFGLAIQYKIEEQNNMIFVVQHHQSNNKNHIVIWNDDTVSCSCQHFEFWGILCRHILKVFIHRDCFKIPSRYILQRWCCQKEVEDSQRIDVAQESTSPFIEDIQCTQNDKFVHCPPCSKTKGRPKEKRQKGGKELGKQKRRCNYCKNLGHNVTTCPDKEETEENFDQSNELNKRRRVSPEVNDDLNPIFSRKI